jgi:hypothetical protein
MIYGKMGRGGEGGVKLFYANRNMAQSGVQSQSTESTNIKTEETSDTRHQTADIRVAGEGPGRKKDGRREMERKTQASGY